MEGSNLAISNATILTRKEVISLSFFFSSTLSLFYFIFLLSDDAIRISHPKTIPTGQHIPNNTMDRIDGPGRPLCSVSLRQRFTQLSKGAPLMQLFEDSSNATLKLSTIIHMVNNACFIHTVNGLLQCYPLFLP